jgi:hypothetical protein
VAEQVDVLVELGRHSRDLRIQRRLEEGMPHVLASLSADNCTANVDEGR